MLVKAQNGWFKPNGTLVHVNFGHKSAVRRLPIQKKHTVQFLAACGKQLPSTAVTVLALAFSLQHLECFTRGTKISAWLNSQLQSINTRGQQVASPKPRDCLPTARLSPLCCTAESDLLGTSGSRAGACFWDVKNGWVRSAPQWRACGAPVSEIPQSMSWRED